MNLRKAVFILVAVVLAPLVLMSVVAFAAGDWHPIGETGEGDRVSVSSLRVKKNLRTAWVRVEFKEPAELPQGGPFVEMRARVRFNCGNGGEVSTAEWFYSRDHSGRFVVSKKATRDDQLGRSPEGGFGEMASKYVCGQK
ncbi:MAG: surface-adhesin E family protein [Candidatus Sulfotelmatobacter sp.]